MLLNASPEFDEATKYCRKWNQKVMDELAIQDRIDLLKDDATRKKFEENMPGCVFLVFYDHGDEGSLVAQGGGDSMVDLANVGLLAGKECFTMACLSSKVLGVEAYNKGCKAYWGYYDVFAFTTEDESIFMEAANFGLILRLKNGYAWEDCYDAVMLKFNELIDKATDVWTKIWLRHDRDALRLYTPERPPQPEECPVSRLIVRLLSYRALTFLRKVRSLLLHPKSRG